MQAPIVTILTPTCNHERYIGQCIASVQAQTFSDWEMLILNDGGTDQTGSIAQSYARSDPRIQVITQPNKGVFRLGETYNHGLAQARGKYIAILEGDDLWMPEKLQRQVAVMEDDPTVIVCSGQAHLVNEDLSHVYRTSPHVHESYLHLLQNNPIGSFIELSLHRRWLLALTLLIRRESLLAIGGFQQVPGMPVVDFPTLLALSLIGRFHFMHAVLAKWRVYPAQTSRLYHIEIHEGALLCVRQHLQKLTGFDPEKSKRIHTLYRQRCLIAYVRSGRYRLIRKEYRSACKDFMKAMTHSAQGMLRWRIKALAGLMVGALRRDIDPARGMNQ